MNPLSSHWIRISVLLLLVMPAVAFAVGLFILYKGVEGLLRAGAQAGATPVSGHSSRRLSVPRFAAPMIGAAALAAAFAVIATGGGDEAPAADGGNS